MEELTESLIQEVLTDFGVPYDIDKFQEITKFLEASFSEEDCCIFYGYLSAKISLELLSDQHSPVQKAMSGAIEILLTNSETLSNELLILASNQNEVMEVQHQQISEHKHEITRLQSENKALRSSLTRLRKLLKAEEVKEALSFCDKLQKQSVVGEIGQKAVLLGESIKNALITIKGV
jgi:regulator of replication initiation timing